MNRILAGLILCLVPVEGEAAASAMEWLRVAANGKGFVEATTGRPFIPWGVNYDHDENSRLLEDYWEDEWEKVVEDFQEIKDLGANVVRIHLQVAKFMAGPDQPDEKAFQHLAKLLRLAEKTGLYLDLTGLGCYRKADVPQWYDQANEEQRWVIQARFWEAVAKTCADSPAVFFYDLMNEPVSPAGKHKSGEWLPGKAFGGFHFVQWISLDRAGRTRPEVARQWIAHLVKAIRKHDQRHLISVGLVDWSLPRKGLTSGFEPEEIAGDLDFLCVHIYPKGGKVDEAIETLKGFSAAGKPVIIEETFALKCSLEEWRDFYEKSKPHAAGWISFYWGKPREELRKSGRFADAILAAWLDMFEREGKRLNVDNP